MYKKIKSNKYMKLYKYILEWYCNRAIEFLYSNSIACNFQLLIQMASVVIVILFSLSYGVWILVFNSKIILFKKIVRLLTIFFLKFYTILSNTYENRSILILYGQAAGINPNRILELVIKIIFF